MSHLSNSGASRESYTLSRLVHEYLQQNYPVWLQEIADRPYPQAMHEILAWDAYLIYPVACVLNEQIHAGYPDLAFLYTCGEVPLVAIHLDMTRRGIGADSGNASIAYAESTRRAEALYEEIAGTEEFNLWNSREVYDLLHRHNSKLRMPAKEITAFDLRRMVLRNPLAAKILEWRALQTDLSFLRAAYTAPRTSKSGTRPKR